MHILLSGLKDPDATVMLVITIGNPMFANQIRKFCVCEFVPACACCQVHYARWRHCTNEIGVDSMALERPSASQQMQGCPPPLFWLRRHLHVCLVVSTASRFQGYPIIARQNLSSRLPVASTEATFARCIIRRNTQVTSNFFLSPSSCHVVVGPI